MKTILISGLTLALAIACSSTPPAATESSTRQATVSPVNTVNGKQKTLVSQSATQPVSQVPEFDDYPATEDFSGTPAPVNLDSHPQARRFRTVLREGAKQGPNFAGKYTVVTWGCGTSCQVVGIINAETGSVYMLENPAEAGVEFQIDSRLLVVNPPENFPENKPDWLETRYYVWDGTQLTQVYTSTSETSAKSENPTVATVKDMVNGDLMCYVTLVDENNIEHNLGATFELCENPNRFLNQKVRLLYENLSVNDCESIEPCGKTRIESLITSMEIVGEEDSENSGNSQILSNGEWTITISNINSWSGVNGTGNLSYRGCDSQGNCIDLTGGQVTCRNGVCTMGWRNGDYNYVITQLMDNPDRPDETENPTSLRVRKGSKVILDATGFRVVSP